MQHRHDHRSRKLQIEPDRDVQNHEQEREEDRDDRRLRDLTAEAGRDGGRAGRVGLEPVLEGSCDLRQLRPTQRLRPDLEGLVLAVRPSTATLDDRVAVTLGTQNLTDVAGRVRHGRLEGQLAPALEVDAEVEAPHTQRACAQQDDRAGDREPEVALAHEVDLQPLGGLLALRTHEPWLVEPVEAGEQPEHRARGADRGDQRDHGADQEHEGEALHLRRRDCEQHQRRDRRHDVCVEDGAEALRVAGGDRSAHGLAGAHFFLDAFEHDDVRVGGDSDRQDQSREPRQGHRDVEEQDRRVQKRRVDPEPDHRDEAEEAVQKEQEERDDQEADDRRLLGLGQRVLAERRRDVGALRGLELDRQRTGLEHEREAFGLAEPTPSAHVDLSAGVTGDAVRVAYEVDVRHRLDLPVEHDREVLRAVLYGSAVALPLADERTAFGFAARDRVEDLLALAGELHRHDGPALRVDVRARARKLQLTSGHLRDRVARVVAVLQQVEACLRRQRLAVGGQTVAGRGFAADDHRVLGDGQDHPVLRDVLAEAACGRRLLHDLTREQELLRRRRPGLHDVLRVEEVPLRRGALGGQRLGRGRSQKLVQRARSNRDLRQAADGGPDEIGLEVVELQHRRLADQLRRRSRIVDAGELDDDLVVALLPDLRLRDPELVDPLAHDVDRATEIFRRELVALRRHRFQDDLEAALQVEAERQLLMDRRARDRQKSNADERRQDAADEDQMATAIFQAESGGSVAGASSSGSSSSLTTPATARLAIRTSTPSAISSRTSSPSTAVTLP